MSSCVTLVAYGEEEQASRWWTEGDEVRGIEGAAQLAACLSPC
jgi:hypothetical protein